MNTDLLLGALALGYGVFTLVLRFVRPDSPMFRKLGPMKQVWGNSLGTVIHWGGYTVLPIVLGAVMLLKGWR